jgi:hypothetical protein
MKTFFVVLAVVLALVLSTSAGISADLPETPGMGLVAPSALTSGGARQPIVRPPSLVDYSLVTSLVAAHAADWITTEKCLRTSEAQVRAGHSGICHEALLPNALVENKAGFAAYEATTAGAEIYTQYLLEKHHHRRIARLAQVANIAGTAYVVAHNYHTVKVASHIY